MILHLEEFIKKKIFAGKHLFRIVNSCLNYIFDVCTLVPAEKRLKCRFAVNFGVFKKNVCFDKVGTLLYAACVFSHLIA